LRNEKLYNGTGVGFSASDQDAATAQWSDLKGESAGHERLEISNEIMRRRLWAIIGCHQVSW